MSNFDYEISNVMQSIRSLAENIAYSAVQEAINITTSNSNILTNNIEAQNINTNNIKTINIKSDALITDSVQSGFALIEDAILGKATIANNIRIHDEENLIELILNDKGIFSIINNNKNALVILQTIKNLLIEANYFTEEKFNNEYNKVEKKMDDIINGEKVAKKLMK